MYLTQNCLKKQQKKAAGKLQFTSHSMPSWTLKGRIHSICLFFFSFSSLKEVSSNSTNLQFFYIEPEDGALVSN